MSAPLHSLPGDIDGLLIEPCACTDKDTGHKVAVIEVLSDEGDAWVILDDFDIESGSGVRVSPVWIRTADKCAGLLALSSLLLDLSKPANRWLAWRWLNSQDYDTSFPLVGNASRGEVCDTRNAAMRGEDMTERQINILRLLVLIVAGRVEAGVAA